MNFPSDVSSPPIGARRPRPATRRLLEGRGRYVDDLTLPRMAHAAFLRSPHARAAIGAIDTRAARTLPGVIAVFTGADLLPLCAGWRGNSMRFPGLNSPLQRALAVERASYQGEPVVVVVASSRAIAEDAVALIEVDWRPEPATQALERALDAPPAHPELASNLGCRIAYGTDGFEAAFAAAAHVVETRLRFGRHTGVPLEARGLVADYDAAEGSLTLHHSHQVPNQIQHHVALMLGLEQHRVRVICPDVGGGFGIKLHFYADEVATAAIAKALGRPVKFFADRLEAFVSDIHARDHVVTARMALDTGGHIIGFDVHDLCGMGAYSIFPRASPVEGMGVVTTMGGPYSFAHFRAVMDAVFQNRPPTAQYRAVGFPIACAVTERLIELGAAATGVDGAGLRRRNYMRPDEMPCTSPNGSRLFELSHAACHDQLLALMDWEGLKAERDRLRRQGVHRGIGLAAFVEMTATGTAVYGDAQIPVIAIDSVTLKIEPSGAITCLASITEQGQGTSAGIAQVVAAAVGVAVDSVSVITGDTGVVPPGGGAWASRGMPDGGETAWQAGTRLRANVLEVAGRLLQLDAAALELVDGAVHVRGDAAARLTLQELARLVYYQGNLLPDGVQAQFAVTHQHRRTGDAVIPTNGIQGSLVEVDVDTGLVRLLGHWCVEDCGRVINPLLVDEQIRGGIVQGIGAALFELLAYDERGQLVSGTLADYLVPMAFEMPDITIGHVETPFSGTGLGAKGVGEGGTCAASAAVLNAVNDALAPFGAAVTALPITPAAVLTALGKLAPEPGRAS
jgi:carbon-monoxide dehydrogenase large subunit